MKGLKPTQPIGSAAPVEIYVRSFFMQFYIFIRTGVNQTEKEKNSTGKEKVDETPIAKGSYTDVIISCSIAVGLLIFGVLAVVFVKRKRKHTSSMCNK